MWPWSREVFHRTDTDRMRKLLKVRHSSSLPFGCSFKITISWNSFLDVIFISTYYSLIRPWMNFEKQPPEAFHSKNRRFLVNFVVFLRTTFLQNTSERLFLNYFYTHIVFRIKCNLCFIQWSIKADPTWKSYLIRWRHV